MTVPNTNSRNQPTNVKSQSKNITRMLSSVNKSKTSGSVWCTEPDRPTILLSHCSVAAQCNFVYRHVSFQPDRRFSEACRLKTVLPTKIKFGTIERSCDVTPNIEIHSSRFRQSIFSTGDLAGLCQFFSFFLPLGKSPITLANFQT